VVTKSRSLRRRRPRLEPRPRVLVVCEGKKTEPQYFSELQREEEVRLVEIVVEDCGGDPKAVVRRALELKRTADREARRQRDQNLGYDEVWCVFDVDEHRKLLEAIDQAKANRISIALSNPCFELWILLHFRSQTAEIHRHDAQSACGDFIKHYDKSISYAALKDGYPDAVRRAEQLDRRNSEIGERGKNPTTWVYRLTERLRELSREELLRRLRQ